MGRFCRWFKNYFRIKIKIMRYICDFHIHSKYSRACSKDLTPRKIAEWCEKKGIDVVATSDFTHPAWSSELQKNLEPAEKGLYKLKDCCVASAARNDIHRARFLVSTEVSCIYKRGGKTRRAHHVILMPSLEAAEKFSRVLEDRGFNVRSDGRPILGIDSEEILKIVLDASPDAMLIPAHAWTPWFSIFGSESGFDSVEECFGENSKYIYALETGLSSDPAMNRRWSALDKYALVSNSDAHSLEKLGREANVFSFDSGIDYHKIIGAIKNRDKEKFLCTLEFFPEEGKYHLDGHRGCGVCLTPAETKKNHYLCPKCKRPVTVGVLHRVDNLADKKEAEKENFIPYKNVVPLQEIIAECFGNGTKSKKVVAMYDKLLGECGTEFEILLDKSIDEIRACGGEVLGEAIDRMRRGNIFIRPGYDGEFGVVKIFNPNERRKNLQANLF